MKASQKAQALWFLRRLKVQDKEKASGRQPRSFAKQFSHTNNIIFLDNARPALVERVLPLTISGLVSEYEGIRFKRVGVRTPLPEDVLVRRSDV